MKFETGDIIKDKYVIIKLIGSGSFGTIYQAEKIDTKEKLAIKFESIKA